MVRAVGAGLVAAVLGLMGCTSSDAVTCGDRTCPAGTVCAQLTAPDELLCATTDQVDACSGMAEGSPCTYGEVTNAWCHDNTCIASVCGNARFDPGEACDDGNTIAGDGTCSADCTSTEICGNHIVDPLLLTADGPTAKEQCDDGNLVSHDGCSSSCQLEVAQWVQLGLPLLPGESAQMTYDSARDRVVIVGGEYRDAGGSARQSPYTFEWNGSAWGMVPTLLSPAARVDAGMVYDSSRHVVVLFGGRTGDDDGPLGDLWEYDGTAWQLRQFVVGPSARSKFGMTYDSKRKKVVVFGGFGPTPPMGFPTSLGDTWEWDGTSWTETTKPGDPDARSELVMAYDPKLGASVMAGGYVDIEMTSSDQTFRDTWRYDGTWIPLFVSSPPVLDHGSAMAYDRLGGRLITYGGVPVLGAPTAETWAFDGSAWTNLNKGAPGALSNVALASDPLRGTVVLYGGNSAGDAQATTWIWDGADWTLATTASDLPSKRTGTATANDTRHGVVWMYGGNDFSSDLDEMWSFDGIRWQQHAMGLPRPSQRVLASIAYDPVHDQVVMFGGTEGDNGPLAPAETWLWNGGSWTQSPAVTQPPSRLAATMFFDTNLQAIVLSAGFGQNNTLRDVWKWDGTSWTPLTDTDGPARAGACGDYDPSLGAGILFGGIDQGADGLLVKQDTYAWDGIMWTIVATPTRPAERFLCGMAYDATARQSVVFGGENVGNTRFGDTWTWNGTLWSPVLPLTVPPIRNSPAMFSDPSGAGVALFGGQQGDASTPNLADTWRLRSASPEPTELCALADVDRDGDGKAGCADEDCWATCAPLCPPGTTCPANAPRCGDSNCDPVETCRSCPGDCECTPVCGDTFCDPGETATSCPGDC